MRFLKYCLSIFIIFLASSCVNNMYVGVPSSYNGHYRSRNYILDGSNFLFIRVYGGGLTIYFADETVSNITGLGYTSISGYDITGYSDTMYVFETGSISGVVVFNGDKYSTIKFSKFLGASFLIDETILDKINSL